MRGESDRVRRVDGWAATGGVLSPFTNDRFKLRRRRVVAIFGLPARVLIFTPGVPYMASNDVRREKGHAELPRRASSINV
jgi:hypothetical protein